MVEIELKLRIPEAARAAVAAAVVGRAAAQRERLAAAYVDTPSRALAAAGLALRLRREGRRWVQTLKGPAGEGDPAAPGLARAEHEVDRGTGRTAPTVDPALHRGTPVGARLEAVLAAHPGSALQPVFATRVVRTVRRVRRGGAAIELDLDQGEITAGGIAVALNELELELVAGAPTVLLDEARRWVDRHGLWLDLRTKAERGERLARGAVAACDASGPRPSRDAVAPPRGARAVALASSTGFDEAWRTVVGECAAQVLANASQIASGAHEPEHVHQLRVGLRRLRTALRLFEPEGGAPMGDGAAALFARLGAVRDADVLQGAFGERLAAAWAAIGADAAAAPLPLAPSEGESATVIVRDPATQHWLLDLLAATLAPAAPAGQAEPALRRRLARRLRRWHRSAAEEAGRWADLDDAARHALRKRIKRLRYALEFSAALFDARAVRRYLAPLRALQERLGTLNDLSMAEAALGAARAARRTGPGLWFALGWIAAQREAALAALPPVLDDFVGARRFWRR